jgi:two-component system phosphate regulon response regulator PhoB
MADKKILVIEDEPDLVELITFNLQREGFQVTSAGTGEDGLRKVSSDKPDLIVLDIMLPGINGLDICRTLKGDIETRHIPVVMLTARNEDIDIVTGLEIGADDYITKPFSPRVLTARIRAVLRRGVATEGSPADIITLGELRIDQTRHQVTTGDRVIELTPTEFELLATMISRPGWVFSRPQLIDRLRDGQYVITDRAIDVQVANLRKKLGKYGRYIETVRGIGYRAREEL